jgi:hypothetical protein
LTQQQVQDLKDEWIVFGLLKSKVSSKVSSKKTISRHNTQDGVITKITTGIEQKEIPTISANEFSKYYPVEYLKITFDSDGKNLRFNPVS